jgi:tRNA threonylcarbamoyladenosine biosynthesis protein TsaB
MNQQNKKYILAFDTATEHLSVAVLNEKGETLVKHNELAFRHLSDKLHPTIETCMKKAGVSFQELACVVCTKGPGSFTSVRVGLSAAQGLSFALNIPVITFNSLETLAHAYLKDHCTTQSIHVWVEAHGGNVYQSTFNHQGDMLETIQSIPAQDAHNKLKKGDILLGNGVNKHPEHVPSYIEKHANFSYIQAESLAILALSALENKSAHVHDLKPLYVHPLNYHKTYNEDGTPK